jgi:hypothetical protein
MATPRSVSRSGFARARAAGRAGARSPARISQASSSTASASTQKLRRSAMTSLKPLLANTSGSFASTVAVTTTPSPLHTPTAPIQRPRERSATYSAIEVDSMTMAAAMPTA